MNAQQFRKFLFFKIPVAWIAGIKLQSYNEERTEISVSLSRWSQNPFRSMFWAVQGMAAEFSTGIMCMEKVRKSGKRISMLVLEQNGKFTKKAVGKITFICDQGQMIDEVIGDAISSEEGLSLIHI